MPRILRFCSRSLRSHEPACGDRNTSAPDAAGSSPAAGIATLAPAFRQALPSLADVRAEYSHEVNAELVYELCAALVREGLGTAEAWKEDVVYPKPQLEKVLGKTPGVPLFQEQAMQIAIDCAGFTPSEADQLRRAMATFKITGGISHFRDKLIAGMVATEYARDFAEKTFNSSRASAPTASPKAMPRASR